MIPVQRTKKVSHSSPLWLVAGMWMLFGCAGLVDPVQTGSQGDGAAAGKQGAPTGSGGSNTSLVNGSGGAPLGTGGAGTGGAASGGTGTGGNGLPDLGTGGSATGGSGPGTGGANSGGVGAATDGGVNGGANGTGGRIGRDGGTSADAGVVPPTDSGTSAPTWTEIYTTMLNSSGYASGCTGAACHNPGTQKNIKLSTSALGYTSIRGIVTPGSSTAGTLIRVLSSGSMPQGRPKMPTADLDKIEAWITAGALNN